ncbi:hypothetical protein SCG7086_AL_00050 [Chlamydiales bacterium SCGC AG-110-P3]|nr:hypothetical protein SCG7086_AL_00050 [Chlamydiales bacterium SCGC AG-110-P3]
MLILIVSIIFGGAIGYAIVMGLTILPFYPKRPAKIGPFEVHGAIRRYWPAITERIGTIAETEFLSEDDLRSKVEQMDIDSEVEPLIDQKMDAFFDDVIKQVPMAAMFLQGSMADTLKEQAKGQLVQLIPELKEKMVDKIGQEFSPRQLIAEKLQSLDLDDVERRLQHEMHAPCVELRMYGSALGAVLGLVQGIVLWILV